MPLQVLVTWIGRQDLEGALRDLPSGPVVDFLRVHPAVAAVLLSDWSKLGEEGRRHHRPGPQELDSGRRRIAAGAFTARLGDQIDKQLEVLRQNVEGLRDRAGEEEAAA